LESARYPYIRQFVRTRSGVMFAGGFDKGLFEAYLVYSNDDGQTWSDISPHGDAVTLLAEDARGRLLVGATDGQAGRGRHGQPERAVQRAHRCEDGLRGGGGWAAPQRRWRQRLPLVDLLSAGECAVSLHPAIRPHAQRRDVRGRIAGSRDTAHSP